MKGERPARAIVGQKIHLQNSSATTWTNHGCLFQVILFFDYVKGVFVHVPGQHILDYHGAVTRRPPSSQPSTKRCPSISKPHHAGLFSDSSIILSKGLA